MTVPGKMLKILLQNVQFYFWTSVLKKCDSKQQNRSVHREVCHSSVHEGLAISTLQRGPAVGDDGSPARPPRRQTRSGQRRRLAALGRGATAASRPDARKPLNVASRLSHPRRSGRAHTSTEAVCTLRCSGHGGHLRRGACGHGPPPRSASSPASHCSARRGSPEADGRAQEGPTARHAGLRGRERL